jgi:hypothetical protein
MVDTIRGSRLLIECDDIANPSDTNLFATRGVSKWMDVRQIHRFPGLCYGFMPLGLGLGGAALALGVQRFAQKNFASS